MTTDLRHLLAIYVHAHQTGNSVPPHIDAEARAALADEPAAPEGGEPTSVTGQPSDEELLGLYGWMADEWAANHDFELPLSHYARAVLARWGNPAPAPPADGEVAELVGEATYLVRELCDQADDLNPSHELFGLMHQAAFSLTRAAELLQRQALVPVSVSERLPGPEDCDAEGRCWWLVSHQSWPCLYLMKAYIGLDAAGATHWLPAQALPLPEAGA